MTVLDPVILHLLTCGRRRVTLTQVVADVQLGRLPVLRVLDKLTREGYLEEVADVPEPRGYREPGKLRQNPTWKLVGDLSSRKVHRPMRSTGRDKIWRAIKRLQRGFTRSDLVRLSGATRAAVEDYTKLLERDGHIKAVGKTGFQKRFNLISAELKRPRISERQALPANGGIEMDHGWLEILRQRADSEGTAATARELGVSPSTISLLLSGKYPASTEKMERRVMKMYGQGGKVVCPVLGAIAPARCAELWNRAKRLGVKGMNPRMIRQHKACLKCDLRNG